ncbi:MAG: hypothetical protein OER22_12595, partial [Gammaproteobacteria bacterium]|nr:hypothetical protein [Gammaproteobacteria bacterium]
MHAESIMRQFRILTFIIPALALAGCGQGDGPESIPGTAATPLPPIPPGFCDNINFEILCPPPDIVNFNGGATTIIDNPDKSGINDSDSVAQMQKFPDDPTLLFGGTSLGRAAAVDFASGTAFTIKVWSARDVRMLFKLEAGNPVDQGASRELEQTVSGSGSWEELCFDFAGNLPTLDVFGIVLIFDNGVAGAADVDPDNWTFFYDDITQLASCPGGGPGPASFPITFDEATPPAVTEFGGAGYAIEPGPAGGDGNALKIVRDGGDVFAGAWVAVPEIPNDAGAQTVSALVYSPTAGIPMVAKVEFGDNMGSGEVQANEAVVVGWQTLSWTFTNLAPPDVYNRFTILPNLGTVDTATNYYFDNITLADGGGGGSQVSLPVTFDDAGVDYELQDFGGVTTTLVADPSDAGNTVASTNKPPGAELWGGVTVANVSGFASALPFTATDTTMTVRVWSPDAGIPVRLKAEDRTDPTISVETEATTTMANAWETLTFDFGNEVSGTAALNLANTYDKASIFFNFGTTGNDAGDKT